MADIEPITREEVLLNSIAEGTSSEIKPITRREMYLSAIAGETELPADMNPITREEIFLQKVLDNGTGGGGGITKAEGDITVVSDAANNLPIINHNLGTKKIAVFIYPKSEITLVNYQRPFMLEYINLNAFLTEPWILDHTQYSTVLTEPVEVTFPSARLNSGFAHISTIANSPNWYGGREAYSKIESDQVELTDNTFRFIGNPSGNHFGIGTYHYIVWKLGD